MGALTSITLFDNLNVLIMESIRVIKLLVEKYPGKYFPMTCKRSADLVFKRVLRIFCSLKFSSAKAIRLLEVVKIIIRVVVLLIRVETRDGLRK